MRTAEEESRLTPRKENRSWQAEKRSNSRAEEAAGALTGDKKLKRERKTDQVIGKIKQKVVDKVKDAVN
jgi:uncharacterized protein YjbJ (UPF0337 family)